MNYWYYPLPTEMFLDLDSKAALLRTMRVLHVWMKDPDKYDLPPIEAIYNYPTSHRNGSYHAHVIVVFTMCECDERYWWFGEKTKLALWMGSDARRACYVLKRLARGCSIQSDLFCSKREYYRPANDTCKCKEKHKAREVTDKCPALKRLLGDERSADYFPRVGPAKIPALQIPVGEVPLKVIQNWRRDGKRKR